MRVGRSILFVVATLVFLGVVGVWVRSYWVADSVHWSDRHRDHVVGSSGGRLMYLTAHWPNGRVELPMQYAATARRAAIPWWDDVERFEGLEERWLVVRRVSKVHPYPKGQLTSWFFVPTWDVWWIPYWPVVVVSGVVPSLWALGWRKRRSRVRRGLCRECGYDLRESGERCPECGAVVVGGRRAEVVAVAHGGGGV